MTNGRSIIQVLGLYLTILPTVGFAAVAAHDNVKITVREPQYTFESDQPLVLDREAKLAAHELELSLKLRPLLDNSNYTAAYREIAAFGGEPSAARLLLAAQLLSLEGDYDAAIQQYQAAIEQMPQLRRAHAGVGTLYLLTERYELARESLSQAVALGANDVQTFAQLGYLNHQLSNPWSAIAAYQQALMLEPDNPQWQSGLLSALVASGNFSSAGALIDELLKKDASDVALWQQRANLAMQQQNPFRALSSLETAIRLGDDNPQNRLAAALLHMRQQNYARATQLLKQNVEDAALDAVSLYPMVIWLLSQNATTDASVLIEAIRKKSNGLPKRQQSLVVELRGRLALARKKPDEAVSLLTQAVDLDAGNGTALLRLARLYLTRGELARASLMFERAEVIEGNAKSAMLGRAQVAIESRDYTEALRLVRKVQQQFPGSHELDGYVQSLTSLHSTSTTSR